MRYCGSWEIETSRGKTCYPKIRASSPTRRAFGLSRVLRATGKALRALDKYCRRIISLSPFCVVATQGPNGADISPRGDPAGFVRVLDDLTLLLPDRVVTIGSTL